jgi:hypothetical protein
MRVRPARWFGMRLAVGKQERHESNAIVESEVAKWKRCEPMFLEE